MQCYPDYLSVFILALHTGARTSEVLRSIVDDYDPKTGMFTIHQTKDRRKPKLRYVPATPMLIEAYDTLAAGKTRGDSLCINLHGEKMSELRYWLVPSIADGRNASDLISACLALTRNAAQVLEGFQKE